MENKTPKTLHFYMFVMSKYRLRYRNLAIAAANSKNLPKNNSPRRIPQKIGLNLSLISKSTK